MAESMRTAMARGADVWSNWGSLPVWPARGAASNRRALARRGAVKRTETRDICLENEVRPQETLAERSPGCERRRATARNSARSRSRERANAAAFRSGDADQDQGSWWHIGHRSGPARSGAERGPNHGPSVLTCRFYLGSNGGMPFLLESSIGSAIPFGHVRFSIGRSSVLLQSVSSIRGSFVGEATIRGVRVSN